MMKDPISDFIIRLKNASNARKDVITFPASKVVTAIADILEREKYLTAVAKKGKKVGKILEITMKYDEGIPAITDVKRVSKLSRRVYLGVKDIKPVLNGIGRMIISTPNGLMTGSEARKAKVGGEALFQIW
jgi:small subunit ribosomal protein S8